MTLAAGGCDGLLGEAVELPDAGEGVNAGYVPGHISGSPLVAAQPRVVMIPLSCRG